MLIYYSLAHMNEQDDDDTIWNFVPCVQTRSDQGLTPSSSRGEVDNVPVLLLLRNL